MKILAVSFNNRRKDFTVQIGSSSFRYPYARLGRIPRTARLVTEVWVDQEVGNDGFSCRFASGSEETVLADQVLEYNRDPRYMRDMLVYQLTVSARERITASSLTRREIIRRLGTSPAQLYRLLDQTNSRKSVDELLRLLSVLDCTVTLAVRRNARRSRITPGVISATHQT